MKYNILLLLSLLFFSKVEAQKNIGKTENEFRLEADIPSQKNNKLYLGQYWNGATYALDSTQISDQGKAIFTLKEKVPAGQYFLHIKPDFQLDLLIDNEQSDIRLYINEENFHKSTISGCSDSELLWDYLKKMQEANLKKDKIEDPATPKEELQTLEKEYKILDAKLELLVKLCDTQHKDKWYGTFLKGSLPVTLPYPQPKNEKEFTENKEYGKAHFFDNINLADPRLWRTNYLTMYIDSYMQQWVDQIPDSIAARASWLVSKTQANDFCFKQMLSRFINQSMHSKVMGEESIWARLAEDYIFDKNITWIDSTNTSEIRHMYELLKNNRIGMKAKNLILETIDGEIINSNEVAGDYLLLYFYDPGCGHCQIEVPKLHNELYAKYKDKGLSILAINIASDMQAWKDFVDKHKLTDWLNCADPTYKSDYWMNYDVSGIPTSYVLKKDKTIVARKIDVLNLEKLFDYYINKNGTN